MRTYTQIRMRPKPHPMHAPSFNIHTLHKNTHAQKMDEAKLVEKINEFEKAFGSLPSTRDQSTEATSGYQWHDSVLFWINACVLVDISKSSFLFGRHTENMLSLKQDFQFWCVLLVAGNTWWQYRRTRATSVMVCFIFFIFFFSMTASTTSPLKHPTTCCLAKTTSMTFTNFQTLDSSNIVST